MGWTEVDYYQARRAGEELNQQNFLIEYVLVSEKGILSYSEWDCYILATYLLSDFLRRAVVVFH